MYKRVLIEIFEKQKQNIILVFLTFILSILLMCTFSAISLENFENELVNMQNINVGLHKDYLFSSNSKSKPLRNTYFYKEDKVKVFEEFINTINTKSKYVSSQNYYINIPCIIGFNNNRIATHLSAYYNDDYLINEGVIKNSLALNETLISSEFGYKITDDIYLVLDDEEYILENKGEYLYQYNLDYDNKGSYDFNYYNGILINQETLFNIIKKMDFNKLFNYINISDISYIIDDYQNLDNFNNEMKYSLATYTGFCKNNDLKEYAYLSTFELVDYDNVYNSLKTMRLYYLLYFVIITIIILIIYFNYYIYHQSLNSKECFIYKCIGYSDNYIIRYYLFYYLAMNIIPIISGVLIGEIIINKIFNNILINTNEFYNLYSINNFLNIEMNEIKVGFIWMILTTLVLIIIIAISNYFIIKNNLKDDRFIEARS